MLIGDIQLDWKQKYDLETHNGNWKQKLYIQISEMTLETKSRFRNNRFILETYSM